MALNTHNKQIKFKAFKNGVVYSIDNNGYPIEVTDTFLPTYTKHCINQHTNTLINDNLGSRLERWMVGVSCMSGCPVKCKFCATGKLKKWRNLNHFEIMQQVQFIFDRSDFKPYRSYEFKINYTRMGEPFLNIQNVKKAIYELEFRYNNIIKNNMHHYVSTIGIKGSDFSWVEGNITLQISLHSLNEEKRNWLIPYRDKMTIKELGQIRTKSNLKTTLNLTLVDESDFDINILKEHFDPEHFFIKISPLNPNAIADKNGLKGLIEYTNLA